jgi:hypothetical protein
MAARAGTAQHRLHARLVSGHSRHLSEIAKADRPFRDLNAAKQALQNIFRDLSAARHSSAIFLTDRPRVLSLRFDKSFKLKEKGLWIHQQQSLYGVGVPEL